VLDEQRVERYPVAPVDDPGELGLGLLGALRSDDPEPVGDPVHVGVDRDRGDAVAEDEDAVRRLRADVGEAHERVELPRHRAAEFREDRPRAVAHRAALHPVETRRADERLDLGRGGRGERRRVGEPGEEAGARGVGVRVARPLREDRADQHLERVLGVVPEVRGPPVARAVERRQPVEDRLPVPRGEAGHGHGRVRGALGAVSIPGSERSGSSSAPPSARRSSPTR
jgi:hypothetical protein